ncbi:MAG: hypothetical protein PWQ51_86 [Methanolobus sp.]|jgi:hypothetical protein|uniref:Uncharacterized protein n=1 Tax=Methanolobus tindarius DSM 2278 TaxID=1090322 RepID=W9DZW0_METTI|nr:MULTISPECIES: hypothetical protein [Methanolobus]ETA69227.1 hypothetical protein MettiDRAFT_2722 [Methanolobus tindarius DSM 2278]MDK2831982.1 hypothetical protein [Methanolobus sp.]MDK2937922.1 hypothetical protein [Methanolobus sp.]
MSIIGLLTGPSIFDHSFDSSVLSFEVITKIQGEDLVNRIWDYYRCAGHKKIRFEVLTSKKESRYIFHKPDFEVDDIYIVQKVTVFSNKITKKQKFDALEFVFEGLDSEKLQIKANFMVLTPLWFYLWIAISFLVMMYSIDLFYGYSRLILFLGSIFVYLLLVYPAHLITSLIVSNKKKIILTHPETIRYKNDFQKLIQQ